MVDIDDEEFIEEFSTFGTKADNPDILDKLKHLCSLYHLDASEIVIQWVAFAHSRKGAPLTSENLDQFERERLSKRVSKPTKTPAKSKSLAAYDTNGLQDAVDVDTADELLGAYSTPSSKASKKRQHTPEQTAQNKRLTGLGRSPAVAPFSPASFSPASATPSQKYSGRKNGGEVVCSFGASARAHWRSSRENACVLAPYKGANSLSDRFKYMFQKLSDKAHVLNDQLDEMAERLREHYKVEGFVHVALPAQDCVTVCGRVCCDSVGKLNAKSVLLEGSRDTSGGRHIPVDLSSVPQYSLFPGQIVAVDGINSTGSKLVAQKVYESIPLPLPTNTEILSNGALSVVVATGPFTTSDSFMFEPLSDLIAYLQREPPDVCIMLGPFLDSKNQDIEKGLGNVTFEDFFKKTVDSIMNGTQGTDMQIVLVPSWRDIHHDSVYPQAPFVIENKSKRLHLVSDPCTLTIDGVVFGITSTDVLFHLGAEEISSPAGSSDRLARLAQHIITQHNYYPLYPPSEDLNIDYDYYEAHAKLPVTPHVLILPSDLRYFVKEISGCVCVNPGRLAKGMVGGTYSRMHIKTPGDNHGQSMASNIAAEILRI